MTKQRLKAATALLNVLNAKSDKERLVASQNSDIEDVLDLIEDIGFFTDAYQISFQVAHHYFYHWVTLYTQPLEPYLLELKKNNQAKYKNVLPLFDRLRLIESRERRHSFIQSLDLTSVKEKQENIQKELNQEIQDCTPKPNDDAVLSKGSSSIDK